MTDIWSLLLFTIFSGDQINPNHGFQNKNDVYRTIVDYILSQPNHNLNLNQPQPELGRQGY